MEVSSNWVFCTLLFFKSASRDLSSGIEHKLVRDVKPYSISTFVSNTCLKDTMCSKLSMFGDSSRTILRFQNISLEHNDTTVISGNAQFESTVIFHTKDLYEIKEFIDYIATSSPIKMRPKCLVSLYDNYDTKRNLIEHILKYAWDNSFLDFSIVEANKTDSKKLIYDYDPFQDVVSQRNFGRKVSIFPDKLKNIHGYSFHITDFQEHYPVVHIKQPKGKVKFLKTDRLFLNFTLKIFNFTIIKKTVKNTDLGWFEKLNVDLLNKLFFFNYHLKFLVNPSQESFEKHVVLVPILPTYQVNISFKLFFGIIGCCGVITGLLKSVNRVQITNTQMNAFNVVRLILSQSMQNTPTKMFDRILHLTITIAFLQLMNEYYSNTIEVQIEHGEVTIDEYEDFFSHSLSPFSIEYFSEDSSFLNQENPHLINFLESIRHMADTKECLNILVKSKNVLCVMREVDTTLAESVQRYRTRVMKLAELSFHEWGSLYYRFKNASPYASKFLQKMRRIKETSLMHIEALLH